jgi:hypothetical protein
LFVCRGYQQGRYQHAPNPYGNPNAKPGARLIKLSDGGGLQLWIMPDGAKRWRFASRLGGAQKLLAIGVYPATGLREAREAREEAKRLLADGQDPAFVKKVAKAARTTASANTFEGQGTILKLFRKIDETQTKQFKDFLAHVATMSARSSSRIFLFYSLTGRHFLTIKPIQSANATSVQKSWGL